MTIARNFLIEIGPPPVRPVLQITAYPAQDDLLAVLQQLGRSGYTIALDDYDGCDDLGPLMSLCSIVRIDIKSVGVENLPATIAAPRMQSALLVATNVPDHATFAACRDLGFTYFQASARCAAWPS